MKVIVGALVLLCTIEATNIFMTNLSDNSKVVRHLWEEKSYRGQL